MNNIENDDFYKGYAARDKVAKEICSKCIYMKTDRQKYKTYKGMLQKQNKIIDAMCQYIASLDNEETICCKTKRYNNCDPMSLGECEQCIREYFEKEC